MLGYMMRWLLRGAGLIFLTWHLLTGSPPLTWASDSVSLSIIPNDITSNLPQEPDEFDRREVEAYYDWRNNLFFRRFNLTGVEGIANYMTARRTYKVSTNQYGYEVAVTFANPLFYWLDQNGDGEFEPSRDEMWIDIEEDGINGNEKLYDPMVRNDAPRGPVPSPPVPSPRGRDRSM